MTSTREVALRIAQRFVGAMDSRYLADAIEAALRDEQARTVEIVNHFSICRDHDQPTHCVQCDLRHKAIAAIRRGPAAEGEGR
jgi:hypothetical protein